MTPSSRRNAPFNGKNAGRRPAVKEFLAAAAAPAAFVFGLVLLAWVMVALPGVIVYTVMWGERAVATVEGCEERAPLRDVEYLDCRGTWRFADGSEGSGHVSGVGRADVGREVQVRAGPFGPYAGGLDRSRHALYPGAFLWATMLPVAGVVSAFYLRARARARWVLAQIGERDGPSMTGRRRWRDARRRTLLRFRASARPPVLAGAGLVEPQEEEAVRRFATRRPFVTARVPGAGAAFFIVRRPGGLAVLDAGGRPTVIVRRVSHSPPRLLLLAPDRTPLGEIATYPGSEDQPGVAFHVVTESGETVADVVARFLRYTVVFTGEPPEHLRHAVLAFAFDALRLTR
ncbi:hypothetical protein E1264_41265 [Actinomadura sp. KC216]|uniref:hypothetical protein n=1 Tax=Actinomadura sp. KC216 TaxID=2530370 RepID=UPI0010501854|nr:hypothetical protein [Actinomadura sp. KC216]TDB73843.1 hypothetical protein E1264_41265 [Actinomadura sp. KC216]